LLEKKPDSDISSPLCRFGADEWGAVLTPSKFGKKIRVLIGTLTPKIEFDCFLQINNLHYCSALDLPEERTEASEKEEASTQETYYTMQELVDNLDLTQGYLPVKFTIVLKK
jgi:hypothetical protein